MVGGATVTMPSEERKFSWAGAWLLALLIVGLSGAGYLALVSPLSRSSG